MSIITREKAKELLPILKAYSEGKTIQHKEPISGTWMDADEYAFHDKVENYRIKPEVANRPFKNAEECWQEMQKHQPFGWVKNKDFRHFQVIEGVKNKITLSKTPVSYDTMFNYYNFADGTPFGIRDEED